MATATAPLTELGVKTEVVSYRVYAGQTAEGKVDEKSVVVTSRAKAFEELDKSDKVELFIEQAVKVYSFGSEEAFQELIPDVDVRLALINAAVGAKLNSKINSTLKEISDAGDFVFEPTAEVFDTLELLREAPKRVSLTPQERAQKMLAQAGFSQDQIAAALAAAMATL